jgi:hypothetical protein
MRMPTTKRRSARPTPPLLRWVLGLALLVLGSCVESALVQVECIDDRDCPRSTCVGGVCTTTGSDIRGTDGVRFDVDGPSDSGASEDAGAEGTNDAGGGSATDSGTTPDTDVPDAPRTDTTPPPDPTRLPEGDPCLAPEECASGRCGPTQADGPALCYTPCTDTCPLPGYLCVALPDGTRGCAAPLPATCPTDAACAPGSVQRERGACGDCDEGERTRTRVCGAGCTWGAWGAWGMCATDAVCAPGDTDQDTEACDGACTLRTRQRACDDRVCGWGPWGDWGGCTAPPAADSCEPGRVENESAACEGCGGGVRTRTRSCGLDGCGWSPWSPWEGCDPRPLVCSPGEIEARTESCGTCGLGSRSSTRTCAPDGCTWQAWSDWGTCSESAPACTPGQRQDESRGCGNCGSQSRSRTCSGGCTWSAWSDWSTCGGQGPCGAGSTRPCSSNDCGVQTCTAACQWDETCRVNTAVGNECLWQSDSGVDGGRWRCCGPSQWQFCRANCRWSTDCAACSGCGNVCR